MNFVCIFVTCFIIHSRLFACEIAEKKDIEFERAYSRYEQQLYNELNVSINKEKIDNIGRIIKPYEKSEAVYVKNLVFFSLLKLRELSHIVDSAKEMDLLELEELRENYEDYDPCAIYLSSLIDKKCLN